MNYDSFAIINKDGGYSYFICDWMYFKQDCAEKCRMVYEKVKESENNAKSGDPSAKLHYAMENFIGFTIPKKNYKSIVKII